MFVDSDGLPKATSNHPAKYWHLIAVEEFSGETANVMPTIFGADQVISSDATSGKFFFNDMFNSGRVEAFHSGNDGGIERGSNANGEYAKFPDGTLICTHRVEGSTLSTTTGARGNVFVGSGFEWSFPHAFAAEPVMMSSADSVGTTWTQVFSVATTRGFTECVGPTPADCAQQSQRLFAIGRWK